MKPRLTEYRTPRTAYSPTRERFRNVDLDVAAPCDLGSLLASLDRKLVVLHSAITPSRSHILAEVSSNPVSAASAIRALVRAVEALRGKARSQWRSSTLRSLNIGYDAPRQFPALCDVVPASEVAAAASIGASIAITIYPAELDDEDVPLPACVAGERGSGRKASRKRALRAK